MPAPVASGWSGRRAGLAPAGKRRLITAHVDSGPLPMSWRVARMRRSDHKIARQLLENLVRRQLHPATARADCISRDRKQIISVAPLKRVLAQVRPQEVSMRTFTTIASLLALVPLSLPAIARDAPPEKHSIGQFLAPACQQISDQAANFPVQQNSACNTVLHPTVPTRSRWQTQARGSKFLCEYRGGVCGGGFSLRF